MEMKEDFNSSNQMKCNRDQSMPPHHLANMVGVVMYEHACRNSSLVFINVTADSRRMNCDVHRAVLSAQSQTKLTVLQRGHG